MLAVCWPSVGHRWVPVRFWFTKTLLIVSLVVTQHYHESMIVNVVWTFHIVDTNTKVSFSTLMFFAVYTAREGASHDVAHITITTSTNLCSSIFFNVFYDSRTFVWYGCGDYTLDQYRNGEWCWLAITSVWCTQCRAGQSIDLVPYDILVSARRIQNFHIVHWDHFKCTSINIAFVKPISQHHDWMASQWLYEQTQLSHSFLTVFHLFHSCSFVVHLFDCQRFENNV